MVSNGINGVKLSIFRFKIGNIHNIALNITKWDFLNPLDVHDAYIGQIIQHIEFPFYWNK